MLSHLVQYARSHNLVAEPGFAPKTVRWGFVLEPWNGSIEVLDLAAGGGPGRTFPRSPELSQPELKRGGPGCRHFLIDSADVVGLLADDSDDPRLRAKHRYFTGLLRQASAIMPRLADMAAVLDDGAALERVRATLRRRKAAIPMRAMRRGWTRKTCAGSSPTSRSSAASATMSSLPAATGCPRPSSLSTRPT